MLVDVGLSEQMMYQSGFTHSARRNQYGVSFRFGFVVCFPGTIKA